MSVFPLDSRPLYKINPKDGSELVLVPGGWFWMGSGDEDADASANEKPLHLHHVWPFYLGAACVTVGQFRGFVKETKHDAGIGWQEDPEEHPVRFLSWNDATAYCAWAGLRLPSEAEWELAARGYRALKYPWGNDWEGRPRLCWNQQKGPKGNNVQVFAHPDGASPLGSFQQGGNLWEWCADAWDVEVYARYAKGDFNPPSQGLYRVLRGGSWNGANTRLFRGGHRYSDLPDFRYGDSGFRAAGTVAF